MLSRKTIVFLFLLLGLLLAGLRLGEKVLTPAGLRNSAPPALLPRNFPAVQWVQIETPGFSCTLSRSGTQWDFVPAAYGRADSPRISLTLETILNAPIRDRITPRQIREHGLAASAFGLDEPRATLSFHAKKQKHTLHFGADTPSGDGVYVRLDENEDIYVVDQGILEILPKKPDDVRDRALFSIPGRAISALEIRRPSAPTIRLEQKAQGAWVLTAPYHCAAAAPAIAAILESLSSATVQRFVWTPSSDSAAAAEQARLTHGVSTDDTTIFLALWYQGSSTPREFAFAKEDPLSASDILATSFSDATIFSVDRMLPEALRMPLDVIRDRRILPFAKEDLLQLEFQSAEGPFSLSRATPQEDWVISRPAPQSADAFATDTFLATLLSLEDDDAEPIPENAPIPLNAVRLDLLSAGQTRPTTVYFSEAPAEETPEAETPVREPAEPAAADPTVDPERRGFFSFLRRTPAKTETPPENTPATEAPPASRPIFVTNPERKLRHVLYGEKASALDFSGTTFASLRSSGILSIPPSSLLSISRHKAGAEDQTLERGINNVWFSRQTESSATPDRAAVRAITGLLSDLTATGVATLFTTSLSEYGLMPEKLQLSFTTSNPAQPVLILLLGGTAPDGSVYLRIKGSTTIFTISPEAAKILSQPLF